MAALCVSDLRKSFPGKKRPVNAVDGISFEVSSGSVFALLGPNGAGKSTTVKMIAGLVRPDKGEILIDGVDPHNYVDAQGSLGAVLEGNRNQYWRLTPLENLQYFGVLKGMGYLAARKRALELLDIFGLAHKRREQVQKLSRGMQQKLAIAASLMHLPKLLLLDEPTLGVDVAASMEIVCIVKQIAADGAAIILTTHQLDLAEQLADRVAIIKDGKFIKESATDQLIQEYSSDCYDIVVSEDLSPSHEALFKDSDLVTVGERRLIVKGDTEALYNALSMVRPLPVESIKRQRQSLASIFLQLTGEAVNV